MLKIIAIAPSRQGALVYTDLVAIKAHPNNIKARLFLFNRCLVVCHDLSSRSESFFSFPLIFTNFSSGDGQKRFRQVRKFSTYDLRILDQDGPLSELVLHDTTWKKGGLGCQVFQNATLFLIISDSGKRHHSRSECCQEEQLGDEDKL